MKLKRILAGALAAVVSISTVALASLSTASATDALGEPSTGWYSGEYGQKELKIVQDWNNKTTWSAIAGKTELYFVFDVTAVSKTAYASVCYSGNNYGFDNWKPSEASPAVEISKPGQYVVKLDCTKKSSSGKTATSFTEQLAYCSIGFYNSDSASAGDSYDVTASSLVGVYAEYPTSVEPDTTEPETTEPETTEPETEPADGLVFNLTTNDTSVVLASNTVTEDGTYTISADGLNYAASGTAFTVYAADATNVISSDTIVTVDEIIINGASYDVPDHWINSSPFDGAKVDIAFWNPWWTTNSIALDTSTTVNSISITYTLTGTGLGAEPDTTEPETEPDTTEPDTTEPETNPTPSFNYKAGLSFADSVDWTPSTWGDPSVEITGAGDYTLTWDVAAWVAANGDTYGIYAVEGCEVFLIDITDAAEYFAANGISIEVTSILCDDKEVPIIDTINQGDLEENGAWRVSLYNSTNEQGNAIDPDGIYAEKSIQVNFKVVTSETPTEETTEEPTEQPTTEPCDVTVSITPDKAYALPGEEVTYTVAVTPSQQMQHFR